jgi:hypothetical protein
MMASFVKTTSMDLGNGHQPLTQIQIPRLFTLASLKTIRRKVKENIFTRMELITKDVLRTISSMVQAHCFMKVKTNKAKF